MSESLDLWELRKKILEGAKDFPSSLESLILPKERIARAAVHPYIGWAQTTGKDVLMEAEAARIFISNFRIRPKVYYFGIGNPLRLGIDIIWPLLICDFSELIAVDIEPEDERDFVSGDILYQKFIRAVTLNLSLIPKIDQEKIQFERLEEKKFEAKFVFQGQERIVKAYYSFDAAKHFPQDLQDGYDILFTRRTRVVFWGIKDEVFKELKNKLRDLGLAVFMELTPKDEIKQEAGKIKERLGSGFLNFTAPEEELLAFGTTNYVSGDMKEKIYLFLHTRKIIWPKN